MSDESDAFFISSACLVILITLIRLTWNTSEQSLFSRAPGTVVVHNVPQRITEGCGLVFGRLGLGLALGQPIGRNLAVGLEVIMIDSLAQLLKNSAQPKIRLIFGLAVFCRDL